MEKQRCARAAALNKQLECGCPDSTCADGKTCSHPMRRISAAKPTTHIKPETPSSLSSAENNNQVCYNKLTLILKQLHLIII